MNRALVVQSLNPDLQITGTSHCDDVVLLKSALDDLARGQTQFHCGDGGTTFRFLLARLSREQGEFEITGSERLLSRPHEPLYQAIGQLGGVIDTSSTSVRLKSSGWSIPQRLDLSLVYSSQFVSAILLSSWGLEQDLVIQTGTLPTESTYLDMTLKLLEQLGMAISRTTESLCIKSGAQLSKHRIEIEPDISSVFAVVAFALKKGGVEILGFPKESLQPDYCFLDIIEAMGGSYQLDAKSLKVEEQTDLKPISWDLQKSPDLFPVLSVLLASVPGTSQLSGLESLQYKESNRLKQTQELLTKLGIEWAMDQGRFSIFGQNSWPTPNVGSFDPDHDHRMAMAAGLAKYLGADILILNPEVVNKSFPSFWEVTGL